MINSGLRYWVVPTFLPLAVARCRPVLVIEWAGAGWNGRAGIYVGIWSSVSDYRHGHSLYPVRRNARRGAAVHPVVGEEQRFDRENAHIAGVGWGGRRRISGLTKLPSRLRAADWSGSSACQMVGRPPTRTTQTQRGFCVGRATTANSVVPPVTAAVRPRDSVRAHPPAETDATSSAGPVHASGLVARAVRGTSALKRSALRNRFRRASSGSGSGSATFWSLSAPSNGIARARGGRAYLQCTCGGGGVGGWRTGAVGHASV